MGWLQCMTDTSLFAEMSKYTFLFASGCTFVLLPLLPDHVIQLCSALLGRSWPQASHIHSGCCLGMIWQPAPTCVCLMPTQTLCEQSIKAVRTGRPTPPLDLLCSADFVLDAAHASPMVRLYKGPCNATPSVRFGKIVMDLA